MEARTSELCGWISAPLGCRSNLTSKYLDSTPTTGNTWGWRLLTAAHHPSGEVQYARMMRRIFQVYNQQSPFSPCRTRELLLQIMELVFPCLES
jgi:hypothetical protein